MGLSYTDLYYLNKEITEWGEKQKRKRAAKKQRLPKLPKAGWYDDPWRQAPKRWWDGSCWTSYIA